ncbi:MAG: Hpt domain-containing protein [Planctomycetota bacterium]
MPNDPSLQELFRHEAQGIVDQLELLVGAGTPEAIASSLRLAHTLKGLAAATEAKPLRDLARSLEAALDGFEPGDEARREALLSAVDAARGLLEATEGSAGAAREAAALLDGPAEGAPRHGVPQARHALWLRMRPSLRELGRSARERLKGLESGRDPRRRRRDLGRELELWSAAAGLLGHTGAAASGLELARFLQERAVSPQRVPDAQALCAWFTSQLELPTPSTVLGAEGLAAVSGLAGAAPTERFGLAVEFPWPDVDLPADLVQAVDRACGRRAILDARPARPSARFVRGILGLSTRRGRRRADVAIQVPRQRLDRLLELAEDLVALRVRTRRLATQLRQLSGRPADEARREVPRLSREAAELDRELDDVARANQQAVLRARRVPLRGLYSLVRVTVREYLTRHPQKACRLEVEGAETRIDKAVLDQVVDPVLQLVRNALEHGVASRAERAAQGKPEVARLHLSTKASAAGVVLEVMDDGEGIDTERLEQAGRRRGLLLLRASDDAMALAFAPGVTTAAEVSDDAGRGVRLATVLERVRSCAGG